MSDIDQLWVADITYVHLAEEFAYLAIVLDAFSRKVIGWAMATHLKAELAIAALDQAIALRRPAPGSLVHHSDRGVQYACAEYAARLAAHRIQPSMSRIGNPYDNAKAERFMRTLKDEEVDGRAYRDIINARRKIGEFIERVYNTQRLHSALDYLSPDEYEAGLTQMAPGAPGGKPKPGKLLLITVSPMGCGPPCLRNKTSPISQEGHQGLSREFQSPDSRRGSGTEAVGSAFSDRLSRRGRTPSPISRSGQQPARKDPSQFRGISKPWRRSRQKAPAPRQAVHILRHRTQTEIVT